MNWNPFRGTTKKSVLTKQEERDFDREQKNIQNLEEASKKLSKDSKKIVAAITAQSKSSSKIGSDLVNDLSDNTSNTLIEFEQAMNKQSMLAADKANMIQHSLVGPLKEYCSIFPLCTQHIRAREKSLQEYKKVHAKLEKYEEKENTAANSVKIEMTKNKELLPAKAEFEQKNGTLMKELPQLYQSRIAYIQPCLEAFLCTQCWYHAETLKSLERCVKEMEIDLGPDDDDDDAKIESILDEIKQLSITSDD